MTARQQRVNIPAVLGDLTRRVRILEATTCPPPTALPFNLGEVGYTGDGSLDDTYTHTIDFQDVRAGDGILVAALAPSVPSMGAPIGDPVDCQDSQGNTYNSTTHRSYEASPPNVNEGLFVQFFFCEESVAPLEQGVDTITVTWLNPVYDRQVFAWIVRHDGGADFPSLLDSSPQNDAGIFASSQVTLQSPDWTPARDNALELAVILTARPLGGVAFGSVAGFDGFYQAKFHIFNGSKQTYVFNCQTFGADAYLVANADVPVPYEIDLGALPGNVFVPAFNGVGQTFSSGANTWKGIILYGVE